MSLTITSTTDVCSLKSPRSRTDTRWLASPLKIVSTRFTIGSNSFCLPRTAPATSRTASPVTIDHENDKNPVIALREIAEQTIPPDDMRESLIHSIQKNVEVDEPEAGAAPVLAIERRAPILGRDDQSSDTQVDVLTEEQLLRGLESMTPSEPSSTGTGPANPRERGR